MPFLLYLASSVKQKDLPWSHRQFSCSPHLDFLCTISSPALSAHTLQILDCIYNCVSQFLVINLCPSFLPTSVPTSLPLLISSFSREPLPNTPGPYHQWPSLAWCPSYTVICGTVESKATAYHAVFCQSAPKAELFTLQCFAQYFSIIFL